VTYRTLRVEQDGPVARVWLDRPARHNALDQASLEEIADVFTTLQRAYDVPVVVLGGCGPSFCSGADRKDPPARLSRASGAGARERRHAAQVGRRALEAIQAVEAITIARLHGHVIGGGLVMALGCDLRIAAAGTSFRIPEVELGVPLTWGALPHLVREVGVARAKELVILGERFDAAAAHAYGLVNRVVPDAELDALVDAWAARIAAQPPWAIHMTKTQFQAYARTAPLGDATLLDGDLLTGAGREDPTRFGLPRTEKPG
jgi:enoyl-CoA hydratase/carnithine racemase